MESPKSDRENSLGSTQETSQENEWTVVDKPPRIPLPKSNPLASMSLNALRRTRSRNDPPPSSTNSADKPNPPLATNSRSNSWTGSLGRRSSTKSSSTTNNSSSNPTDSPTSSSSGPGIIGIDRDPPTPPSPAESSSSRSSHETVTPPAGPQQQQQQQQQQGGQRVRSTLATLASPSTYYKPAARLFRPSSSGGSSSRPSTAGSVKLSPFPSIQPPASTNTTVFASPVDMTSSFTRKADMSTEELDRHADQLIKAAIQRAKDANSLTRTESNASTSSQSRPDPSPSSSAIHHSASLPAVIPLAPTTSRTSWFGFGGGNKEERRLAKEEKRGRKSRPTSDVITAPIITTTTGSRPTSTSGRPATASGALGSGASTPIGSPNVPPMQIKSAGAANTFAAVGASLPSAPIKTIREGVPLTHSLTVDSVMTTASEDRRGRTRARSSSPFRAFRSSRSRGGFAKEEKEKKREKSSGRSPSPAIHALKRSESDAESDAESLGLGMRRKRKGVKVRRTAFDQRSNTGETEDEGGEDDEEEEEWSDDDEEDEEDDDDGFDPETTQNTEANATPLDPEVCLSIEGHNFPGYDDDIELPDPLGEGVNVVRPEAPMFAQTLMAHTRPATTSPARARAASPRSVNTGGSGGDDDKQRSSSIDGQSIGAVASSPTAGTTTSPTTSTGSGGGPALTPAQVAARTPKKKKTIKSVHSNFLDPLPLNVSRPHFTRDRCTVVLKHGHPRERSSSNATNATAHPVIPEGVVVDEMGQVDAGASLGGVGGNSWRREAKRYVVFSDMSEESKWAVEWGIGTVLRDGDEMILVTVQETDSKLDPAEGATVDRLQKLRNQQERQALASLLVRQATSLLQRTKLNVTVTCQAMHAKNARRLFLDIIDLLEPTMVIVGSRGLGKLKGILLGSTSHYLIQKSSVPVMVARRRLKRPTRKSHTAAQAIAIRSEKRVSLAEARIEKMSSGQGKGATGVDVEDIQREHEEAEKEWPRIPGEDEVVVEEEEEDDEEQAGNGDEQQTPQSPSISSRADSPSAEKRAPGVSAKVAGD